MGVFKRTVKSNEAKREYWYIDYVINGKRKWESVGKIGDVTKADAKKLLARRRTDILQGKYKTTRKRIIPTFKVFASQYLQFAKGNKKSWERDFYALKSLIPFLGHVNW